MSLNKLSKTTLLTKGTDAAAVIDAYAKPDGLATAVNSTTAVLDSAKKTAMSSAIAAVKGAANDKQLQTLVKGALRGKVSKDVALGRLKDVLGSSVLKGVGDPTDLKKKLMGGLLSSAGFNVDAKGLIGKLKGVSSLKDRLEGIKGLADKYSGYGISFDGGSAHCSNGDGKGLLDMLNGALGKNRFKGIDFGLKFKSMRNLFSKLPKLGVDGMFESMMDMFPEGEERNSFLSNGLKDAFKNFNWPHLKMAKFNLGGGKLGAEFPDFNLRMFKGFTNILPKCEIDLPSIQVNKREELKSMARTINLDWDKYLRDDSHGTGKGDGTGGTGQAVQVANLEPFTKMSEDAKVLMRTDPDPDMQLNLLIADNYKSVRLAQYGKALYPMAAYI